MDFYTTKTGIPQGYKAVKRSYVWDKATNKWVETTSDAMKKRLESRQADNKTTTKNERKQKKADPVLQG
jgi:hypothetical protein